MIPLKFARMPSSWMINHKNCQQTGQHNHRNMIIIVGTLICIPCETCHVDHRYQDLAVELILKSNTTVREQKIKVLWRSMWILIYSESSH